MPRPRLAPAAHAALGRLVSRALDFAAVIVVAHTLALEAFAAFALVAAHVSLFAPLTHLGDGWPSPRFIAAGSTLESRHRLPSLLSLRLLLGLGAMCLCWLSVDAFGASAELGRLLVIGAVALPLRLRCSVLHALELQRGPRTASLTRLASSGLFLIATIVLARIDASLDAFVGAGALSALPAVVLGGLGYRPLRGHRFGFDTATVRALLGKGWVGALAFGAFMACLSLDLVMVALNFDRSTVGHFAFAMGCAGVGIIAASALPLPRQTAPCPQSVSAAIRYLATTTVFGTSYAVWVIEPVYEALFRAPAGDTGLFAILLGSAGVPLALVHGQRRLAGSGPGLAGAALYGTAAILNLAFNGWAIPRWGPAAAAAGTLAVSVATLLFGRFLPELRATTVIVLRALPRPIAASLVVFLIWGTLPESSLLSTALIGAVAYIVMLTALGGITRADLARGLAWIAPTMEAPTQGSPPTPDRA